MSILGPNSISPTSALSILTLSHVLCCAVTSAPAQKKQCCECLMFVCGAAKTKQLTNEVVSEVRLFRSHVLRQVNS